MAVHVLLLLTGLFLGAGLPLARWLAPQGVEPLAFALWPTAAAGVVLALVTLSRGQGLVRAEFLRFGAIAGLTGYALPMTLAFWLAGRAGAAYAAIAFTLPPLFTLAVNLLMKREPWRWLRLAAIGIGLAGAAMLVTPSGPHGTADVPAMAAVFAIPLLIGATNVYRAIHLPTGAAATALAALTLLAASAVLAVAAVATHAAAVPLTLPVLGGLAMQGTALVAGYIFYFKLQARADPVVFSLMGYVIMLTGVLAGVLLLGEQARWAMVPALLLILLAIRMVAR